MEKKDNMVSRGKQCMRDLWLRASLERWEDKVREWAHMKCGWIADRVRITCG